MKQPLELTGQRFGKLTALRRAENVGRDTAWLCRCDCGAETVVRTAYLRRGKARSCGCDAESPKLAGSACFDLTGMRFGKLTALEPLGKSGRTYKWRCRCDCGGECAAAVANLRNGHTRSCGCESRAPRVHNVEGTCVEVIRSNRLRVNNTSGAVGVERYRESCWRASICFKGERHYLGLFSRFEDAVQARKEAEEKYFGAFLADYDARQTAMS